MTRKKWGEWKEEINLNKKIGERKSKRKKGNSKAFFSLLVRDTYKIMLEQTGRDTPNHHLHCAKNHGPFLLCTSVVYINVGTRWTQRDGDTSDVHIPGHTHTQSNIHKIQSFRADGELCSRQENKTRASYRLLAFFFSIWLLGQCCISERETNEVRWGSTKTIRRKKKTVGEILFSRHSHVSLFFTARIGNEGKIDPNNVQFRH